MLVARLSRVTPGRPEADLGIITIVARSPRRPDPKPQQRFDGLVVTGPGGERYERHVYVTGWDSARPAIELLHHVLSLAIAEQAATEASAGAVAVTVELARYLAKGAEIARRTGQLPAGDAYIEAQLADLFSQLAPGAAAVPA